MPSPTSSSSTSSVGQTTSLSINALLSGDKWGGVTGTGVTLSYSFPWRSAGTATFSGLNGSGDYSELNEYASSHYSLSTTQQVAARGALQSWANVAKISFSEVADTSVNVGDIRFAWTSASNPASTGGQAWGWAYYPSSYSPAGGDIWISTLASGVTNPAWSVGSYNYLSLIHEIGHALGLKHSFEDDILLPNGQESRQYTVMSYTDHPHSLFVQVTHNANGSVSWESFDVVPDTPMLYDVAAMQYIYGANLSYKTGNDVYTFDPGAPFIRTLWDAGGTDTISVSNFTKGCAIDLQQGHFSKITIESDSTSGFNWISPPPTPTYDGTDNLAIAFGAVIEDAIGGSGNDTLIGNDSNNSLDGGAGNDALYGGAGNDTFDWGDSGRGGNDVFYGGTGDDVYVLDSSLDSIAEYQSEGVDTVWVPFSYSILSLPYIENLRAFGTNGVSLNGNYGDNTISGSSSNDTLGGSSGNDILNGGSGTDTSVFGGNLTNYTLTKAGSTSTVRDNTGTDGTDTLTDIERLQFADTKLAIDMGVTQSAGETALLIGAVLPGLLAFDPSKQALLGSVIDLFDSGYSMRALSGAVLRLPIWDVLTGHALSTKTDIANYLLTNINGHTPDQTTLAAASNALNTESFQGDWLASLALSAANQTHVDLVGLASSGLAYL